MLYLPPAYVTLLFLVHVFYIPPSLMDPSVRTRVGRALYVYEAAQVYHMLFGMREFKVTFELIFWEVSHGQADTH